MVPLTLGPSSDLFFLSFDQLGSNVHAYVEPPVTIATPTPTTTPQPDFGVTTFERVTHTMAKITGVPFTNTTVYAQYMSTQQAMPSTPLISAFVSSQQTSIWQLANAYCGQLVGTAQYRDAFFGTGLDSALMQSATFFNSSTNRQIVETALGEERGRRQRLPGHGSGRDQRGGCASAAHSDPQRDPGTHRRHGHAGRLHGGARQCRGNAAVIGTRSNCNDYR